MECRLEYCLYRASLLESGGLGLGATQNMAMCLWTEMAPWTGRQLGWFALMEHILCLPEPILELECC
jgi:hypothetical protein